MRGNTLLLITVEVDTFCYNAKSILFNNVCSPNRGYLEAINDEVDYFYVCIYSLFDLVEYNAL